MYCLKVITLSNLHCTPIMKFLILIKNKIKISLLQCWFVCIHLIIISTNIIKFV